MSTRDDVHLRGKGGPLPSIESLDAIRAQALEQRLEEAEAARIEAEKQVCHLQRLLDAKRDEAKNWRQAFESMDRTRQQVEESRDLWMDAHTTAAQRADRLSRRNEGLLDRLEIYLGEAARFRDLWITSVAKIDELHELLTIPLPTDAQVPDLCPFDGPEYEA